MDHDHAKRRLAERLRPNLAGEPVPLHGSVAVEIDKSAVFLVGVALVLTAVHDDEADRAVVERIVVPILRQGDVVREPTSEPAPGLVIAPHIDERGLSSEKLRAGREHVVDDLLCVLDVSKDIAVEKDEIEGLRLCEPRQRDEDFITLVNIVQDDE